MKKLVLTMAFTLLLFTGTAQAVMPDEQLADPAQEARARALFREIKCLVCQGEAIDESRAGLATDLRALVRQRIAAGDSDAAALDYIAARYGDSVRLNPKISSQTLVLWFAPFGILLLAGGIVYRYRRQLATAEGVR